MGQLLCEQFTGAPGDEDINTFLYHFERRVEGSTIEPVAEFVLWHLSLGEELKNGVEAHRGDLANGQPKAKTGASLRRLSDNY